MESIWIIVSRGDLRARCIADRHYNRQSKGNVQFCRPGHNLVMLTADCSALWVSWHPTNGIPRQDELGAVYECTIFRNEGSMLSSELILQAMALTENIWGGPEDGWVTYVDISKVKSTNPGYCFLQAGWGKNGFSNRNKNLLRLRVK